MLPGACFPCLRGHPTYIVDYDSFFKAVCGFVLQVVTSLPSLEWHCWALVSTRGRQYHQLNYSCYHQYSRQHSQHSPAAAQFSLLYTRILQGIYAKGGSGPIPNPDR